MPLSKEEINKIKCGFDSQEEDLSRRAVRQLITLASIYLSETGFSNYAAP
jgi:hypothetical protein